MLNEAMNYVKEKKYDLGREGPEPGRGEQRRRCRKSIQDQLANARRRARRRQGGQRVTDPGLGHGSE